MKKTAILTLSFFVIGSLYLCPCKAAFASSPAPHNCCDKMSNCPSKKETKGMKNLLSSFSTPPLQDRLSDFYDVFARPVVYEINQSYTDSPQFFYPHEIGSFPDSSPPDLFIKYASLLI